MEFGCNTSAVQEQQVFQSRWYDDVDVHFFYVWHTKCVIECRCHQPENTLHLNWTKPLFALVPWSIKKSDSHQSIPRWRQLKYFLFSTLLGGIIQCDEHIFQMGWFNHQLDPFCTPLSDQQIFVLKIDAGVESRRTVSLPEESRWGGVSEKPGVIEICFSLIFVQVHGLYTMWCFKTRIRFFVPDPHSSQDFPQFGAASWDSKGPKSLNAIPPLLR